MGELDGKVAVITGAARGQGRAHAVRLAEEGADIIAIDICEKVPFYVAKGATEEDLAETARQVEKQGRRILTYKADVRDYAALKGALDAGVAELGRLDIVLANAGALSYGRVHEIEESHWRGTIDIVLTGVWNTCRAALPTLIEQGQGGSIILTSSVAGSRGLPHMGAYVAAKHGVIGLMRTIALEYAGESIRANAILPGTVDTAMVHNEATYKLFAPDIDEPTSEVFEERLQTTTALPVAMMVPEDIANMAAFLASDRARYITGSEFVVDAGAKLL